MSKWKRSLLIDLNDCPAPPCSLPAAGTKAALCGQPGWAQLLSLHAFSSPAPEAAGTGAAMQLEPLGLRAAHGCVLLSLRT